MSWFFCRGFRTMFVDSLLAVLATANGAAGAYNLSSSDCHQQHLINDGNWTNGR
jgi:hypothetical protein